MGFYIRHIGGSTATKRAIWCAVIMAFCYLVILAQSGDFDQVQTFWRR